MATEVTKSAADYIKLKQLRPTRAIRGRYAMNTVLSHRRPLAIFPVWLPIPDPSNTVRTEVDGGL